MTSQSLSSSLESVQPPQAEPTLAEGLYLQLSLDRSLPALLPAPQLVEVMTVAIGQIVPIFHLPPWVMGVHNWRGEVLWIIDLNHLLGLTPWYEQADYGSKHTVVVLREMGKSKEKAIVGLTVNRVEEMVECTADYLHSLSDMNTMPSCSPDSLPEPQSDSLTDPSFDSFSGFQSGILPVTIRPFLAGYWQKEVAPPCWLLNSAAILQSLSATVA